jgi:hypothetical protein
MHVHIALFRWKPDADPQRIKQALFEIESLAFHVPGIVEISCRENKSRFSEGYTHVVLVRGNSADALQAYRSHPIHERAARAIDEMEGHGIGVDFVTEDE